MSRTLKDVLKMIKEEHIEMVDFKMTDVTGRWRHLSIPAKRLNEDTMEHGIGFDGSNYGYAPVEKSDMVFVPILDSAMIDPYAEVKTLSMIGDVCVIEHPQNRPFDQYPRNVAKRALEYMKETGVADEMLIGPEYEFYIFDEVDYMTSPEASGFSIRARQADFSSGNEDNNHGYLLRHGAGYHASLPMDINHDLRSRMCMTMEEWGIDVKYHHHEVGRYADHGRQYHDHQIYHQKRSGPGRKDRDLHAEASCGRSRKRHACTYASS